MRASGCDIKVDCSQLAIIGAIEILFQAKSLWHAMQQMRQTLKTEQPDLLILIDYSGFNLRLAKYANALKIKCLYYISPHLWAWRGKRIKTIQRCIDHMAVIFPFEVDFYQRHHVPVTYVGNALVQKTMPTMTQDQAYAYFGLNPKQRVIAILPGSRQREIKYMLPVILETAAILKNQYPDLQFALPLASGLTEALLKPYLDNISLPIKLIKTHHEDLLSLCVAAISKSGTITLQLALLGIPMVIIYKMSKINFAIGKRIIKVDKIGLPNLVADKLIVPEFIQHEATSAHIVATIKRLLDDEIYATQMRHDLAAVKAKLVASENQFMIADVVMQLLYPKDWQNRRCAI